MTPTTVSEHQEANGHDSSSVPMRETENLVVNDRAGTIVVVVTASEIGTRAIILLHQAARRRQGCCGDRRELPPFSAAAQRRCSRPVGAPTAPDCT
jgi:hypothetical protein